MTQVNPSPRSTGTFRCFSCHNFTSNNNKTVQQQHLRTILLSSSANMTRLSILSSIIGAVAVAAQTVTQDGCYSSAGSLQSYGTNIYQSTGLCAVNCQNMGKSAMALMGSECFCGDELPAASDKVDKSKCNTPCPGYPMNTCMAARHVPHISYAN